MTTKIKHFLLKNKLLVSISIFYFIFRIINITKLPIFNDEAIYLDWGYRETHIPGMLFYSLYDSKQPFLMWIFGIMESLFSDPLFAGRFVSVCCGFLTLIGLYKLSKEFFDKKIALLSAFFYTLIPIFSFYDRQALMESAVASIGVWSCYFTLKYILEPEKKYNLFLGAILGIGFFIKSTVLIFIVLAIFSPMFFLWKKKPKSLLFLKLLQSFLVFVAVNFLLFLQPNFWITFSSNNRYSFSMNDLLHFPFVAWFANLKGFLLISFFYVTPLIFAIGLFGLFLLSKQKQTKCKFLFFWFVATILLDIFLLRGISQRYLISYLPLITLFASVAFFHLYNLVKLPTTLMLFCSAILPFALSLMLIFAPDSYILSYGRIAGYADTGYVNGFTSGYGLGKVFDFINSQSAKNTPVTVGVAVNAGNPENALFTYYEKSQLISVRYFDGRMAGNALNSIDCLTYVQPLYFISRGEFLTNLNKFLMPVEKIHVRQSTDFIGIYTLKTPCSGKAVQLNFQ